MYFGHQVGRAVNLAAKIEPLSVFRNECKFVANHPAFGLDVWGYRTRKVGL
jgi:hypothetical protein